MRLTPCAHCEARVLAGEPPLTRPDGLCMVCRQPIPVIASPESDLPTSVDLRLVHWGLELGLRGGRTVEEAQAAERRHWNAARAAFERSVDRAEALLGEVADG